MKMHYPGNALARYRDQTEVKGSKKTAAGWRCAECHQAREYRKAIKGAA